MPEDLKSFETFSPKAAGVISKVRKRDGKIVDFDITRISTAVYKAMQAAEEGGEADSRLVAERVLESLLKMQTKERNFVPTVEGIQDVVEKELILGGFVKTSKAYILYRERHAELRRQQKLVPEHIQKLAAESKKYFRNQLSEFVYYSTYSKWIPEEGRRETWLETVDRYVGFMRENLENKLTEEEYAEIKDYMLN